MQKAKHTWKDKNALKGKAIASFLTIFIIGILIISGPAQGFSVGLDLDNLAPTSGDIITFTAEINIETAENLPVNELTLVLVGGETVNCKFDVLGNIISGCKGITITRTNQSTYSYGYGYGYYGKAYYFGYGYGYGSGKLVYSVVLDTSDYATGTYTTELRVKIGSELFQKPGQDFTISAQQTSGGGGGGGCETAWTCSEWTECSILGQQTRTCEKIRPNCYGGQGPEQLKSCIPTIVLSELTNDSSNKTINRTSEITKEPFISRITGGAIGVGNKILNSSWANVITLLFACIIILFILILLIKKLFIAKKRKLFY